MVPARGPDDCRGGPGGGLRPDSCWALCRAQLKPGPGDALGFGLSAMSVSGVAFRRLDFGIFSAHASRVTTHLAGFVDTDCPGQVNVHEHGPEGPPGGVGELPSLVGGHEGALWCSILLSLRGAGVYLCWDLRGAVCDVPGIERCWQSFQPFRIWMARRGTSPRPDIFSTLGCKVVLASMSGRALRPCDAHYPQQHCT